MTLDAGAAFSHSPAPAPSQVRQASRLTSLPIFILFFLSLYHPSCARLSCVPDHRCTGSLPFLSSIGVIGVSNAFGLRERRETALCNLV
jgi:peptidoglycan biosynthesis protein MviN/MurJ (putative lipid II flippase)